MKKQYRIEVDCPNCANQMEAAASKTEGVRSAGVNFITQRLTVEFEDGAEEAKVMEAVCRNCKKVEDSCVIYL